MSKLTTWDWQADIYWGQKCAILSLSYFKSRTKYWQVHLLSAVYSVYLSADLPSACVDGTLTVVAAVVDKLALGVPRWACDKNIPAGWLWADNWLGGAPWGWTEEAAIPEMPSLGGKSWLCWGECGSCLWGGTFAEIINTLVAIVYIF